MTSRKVERNPAAAAPACGSLPRLAGLMLLIVTLAVSSTARAGCDNIGRWVRPSDGAVIGAGEVYREASGRGIVLLGERHDSAEDHRWQLHTLAALHGREPRMVIGFEMFPRAVQPALDRWVAGELDEKSFLRDARWQEVWGFDAGLYMPLFHFARMHRVPMRAVNVARSVISAIGSRGWANVPEAERGGIGQPAPASPAYRERLAKVFEQHVDETNEAALERFVEAQLAWDRAMAEALFAAHEAAPDALIVGIIGRGHLEFGHGVPHQLANLGATSSRVLLTAEAGTDCPELPPGIADAVFLVAPDTAVAARKSPLRLGVVIEAGEGGLRIRRVVEKSVAETTGLAVNDVIVEAAGRPMRAPEDLTGIIGQLVPGVWLPLEIRRAEENLSLIARFPVSEGDAR